MRSYIVVVLLVLPLASVGDYIEIPLRKEKDKTDKTGLITDFRSRYSGDIDVGTPPQRLKAIFNTGSASIWTPVAQCVAKGVDSVECKESRNVFFPKMSKTFVNISRFFETGYGGSTARGYVFKDRLSIRGKNGKDLVFSRNVFMGAANYLENSDDAVFGLPSQQFAHSYEHSYSTILHQKISNQNVNSTFFILYTAGCGFEGCGNRAMLIIGGQDYVLCKAEVNYTTVLPASPVWEFKIEGLAVRGHFNPNDFTASVDSGSGYISVPSHLLSMYVTRWNATALGKTGAYGVKCSTQLNVVVKINDICYPIPSENLLHPLPEKGQHKFGGSMCQIAMKESDNMNVVTLGEPFLRSYCVVHDIGGRRIGFSHKHREDLRNEDEDDRENNYDQVERLSTLKSRTRRDDRGAWIMTTKKSDNRKHRDEKKDRKNRKNKKDHKKDKKENKKWYERSSASSSEEEYRRHKKQRDNERRDGNWW